MQSDPLDHTPNPEDTARRASRAAGTHAAIHRYEEESEAGLLAQSGGPCAGCAHVAGLPWGPQACRRSREKAANSSIRRKRPIPFLCHMGFSCVSMAMPGDEVEPLVLTLGPFQPRDTPNALEADAREGLSLLVQEESDDEALPFTLDDIPIASADAVPEIAVWTAERYASQAKSEEAGTAAPVEADDEPPLPRARSRKSPMLPVSWAQDLVSTLAAGDSKKAREVVRSLLEEVDGPASAKLQLQRHRAHRILASALEAGTFAGMDTVGVELRMERFLQESALCRDSAALSRWVMKTLAPLKPKLAKDAPPETLLWLKSLDVFLKARIPEAVTLEEAAAALELNPSTLTKRLQRKFKLSFSDYVGRYRVQRAKELIIRTQLTNNEVAKRVGLNDTSNFSKLFQKHTGNTPAQYRKQLDPKR